MDSKAPKPDQESISFPSDSGPKSKPNIHISTSSFSSSSSSSWSWTSSDDDAPPSPTPTTTSAAAVTEIAISSPISDEDDDVDSLLDFLSRESLISLLLSSSTRNAGFRRQISREAKVDPANCKIVVRNLPWRTTSHDLYTFFSQYGVVKDCHVETDCSSGRSKGFGFVHFLDSESATRALRFPEKCIGDRVATCLLVRPRHTYHNYQHVKNLSRKIYVSRVEPGIDSERLYEFFTKYGEIEEGPIGFNKYTGKSRGYAMFVYKTEEGARRALEEPMKNFEGYLLYCQPGTVGRVRYSGFRPVNCLRTGQENGSQFEAPPAYEDRQGSRSECA